MNPRSDTLKTVDWDEGRLRVNLEFAEILNQNRLTTFDALMTLGGGQIAKHVIAERPTMSFVLQSDAGPVTWFLKRHAPARLKEYLKPLIRFRWPKLGARPEWDAILRFRELGIPTMTPVAIGQSGRQSFLVTVAIEGCEKLSTWMERTPHPVERSQLPKVRHWINDLACIARTMHHAGMHHQDFYAGHILLPNDPDQGIHILDLGRVRQCRRLSTIWIVKDLAQLHYSTGKFTLADRMRFLKAYLGRPLGPQDRAFIRRIVQKAASIARHSKKHKL